MLILGVLSWVKVIMIIRAEYGMEIIGIPVVVVVESLK